jgi:Arc/MetJ-type ribon-helix-helix transcriptional regulator
VKLSVSLPEDDVAFLDSYATARGISSRSAAMHKAVRLLRASELGPNYEEAWNEWTQRDDGDVWDVTVSGALN